MKILSSGATHVGRVRYVNEDAFGIFLNPWSPGSEPAKPQTGLFVVADGLGGHAGGEVASRMAVDTLGGFYPFPEKGGGTQLLSAIRTANQRIRQRGLHETTLYGMGTTLVAILIQGDHATVVHVGDSRAYLIQGDQIRQVTRDHTVVEEKIRAGELSATDASRHPAKHILSRALGVDESVDIDQTGFPVKAGDLLLLCSDGLTNMVSDDEILQAVSAAGSKDVSAAPHELIDLANEKGGVDNITVVVVKAEDVQ